MGGFFDRLKNALSGRPHIPLSLHIDWALSDRIRPVWAVQHEVAGPVQILMRDEIAGDYYLMSGAYIPRSGWEILVFTSDMNGYLHSSICGGRGYTYEEALRETHEFAIEMSSQVY